MLRRFLRWLLELDKPVPQWSEDERVAFQQRWLRWNFTVNVTEGACWWFGMSFASAATILPLFISKLTSSKLPLAILAAMASSGWCLPQVFTANQIERLARKKAVVVNLGFFTERLPICFWPMAPLLAVHAPVAGLVLFLVSHAVVSLGGGIIATGWTDLVANCFPVSLRGRMFGFMVVIGSGAGIIGAKISKHLIEAYPFPYNFAYTFAVAAAGIMASFVLLALTKEPISPVLKPRESHRAFFASLPALVRADGNLRAFLWARLLIVLGGMGSGFVMVSATARFQVPDARAGDYTAALMLGQVLGNLWCGVVSDRQGHKITLQTGVACSCLAFALAAIAPAASWYYTVFFLMGLAGGAFFVSGILMTMELATPERRPTYVGLVNTSVGLAGIVAPLLGAGLAKAGYGWLFAIGAACQVVGLAVLTLRVKEPRPKPEAR